MTEMNLKRSRKKNGTPATTAGRSLKPTSPSVKLPFTLTVLNDLYLVREDEQVIEGESEAVVEAIETGKLHIPEAFEAYYKKVPYTGVVVSKGEKTKYDIPIGSHILYGKFAVQRFEYKGEKLLIVKESDVHGIIG